MWGQKDRETVPQKWKGEKKKTFFARRFKTIFKQKCSYLRPLLSITLPQGFRISTTIGHPTSGNGGKKTVKWYLKSEKVRKKKLFFARRFKTIFKQKFQMFDHFFPLLFPKDSESLKILDIRLREVGAKRPLNGTSKVNGQTNRQTDRQTDRHTDRRTFWLIESIGPEGRCFENSIWKCSAFPSHSELKYARCRTIFFSMHFTQIYCPLLFWREVFTAWYVLMF